MEYELQDSEVSQAMEGVSVDLLDAVLLQGSVRTDTKQKKKKPRHESGENINQAFLKSCVQMKRKKGLSVWAIKRMRDAHMS